MNKKILSFILATTLTLSMTGCSLKKDKKLNIENINKIKITYLNPKIESKDTFKLMQYEKTPNSSTLGGNVYTTYPDKDINGVRNLHNKLDKSILISRYSTISEPFKLKYYSNVYGGIDKDLLGDRNGWFREVTREDGKKDLVDCYNFRTIISGYENLSEPFKLDEYAKIDNDSNNKLYNGYVQELIKDNTRYLIDASDFKVLWYGYESNIVGVLNNNLIFEDSTITDTSISNVVGIDDLEKTEEISLVKKLK